MKFFVFALALALVALINATPVSISNNNVGDVVNVGVNLDLVLSNSIHQNIVSIIGGLLNQQAIVAGNGQIGNEKIALLKKLLNKEMDLPKASQAASIQNDDKTLNEGLSSFQERAQKKFDEIVNKMKLSGNFELPENFKLPENLKLPVNFKVPDSLKDFKLPENFKIPDGIELPEIFQQK